MNTTILIKENRTQLVLHPESEHDSAVLDILEKLPSTHRVGLYDRQGGYTMFDVQNHMSGGKTIGKDLMIVFDAPSALGEASTPEKKEGKL